MSEEGDTSSPRSPDHRRQPLGCAPSPRALRAPVLTVTNLNDTGAGSLRNAIATSAAGDTIQFQAGLTGTIQQTAGELRADLDPMQIGRFLGVVLDGLVMQRAAGFDPPTDVVLGLLHDALAPGTRAAPG